MEWLRGNDLEEFILNRIKPNGSVLMTDEHISFDALDGKVATRVVNHKDNYVVNDGLTRTNTIEGFWAGVKRAFYGVHHWYSERWINLYVAEAYHRYNERHNRDIFGSFMKGCFE